MRFIFVFLFLSQIVFAQFAPPAGQAGTTAMYKDSSDFIAWSDFCVLQRGLQDISNTSGGYVTIGDSSNVVGQADNGIVSLGDGGVAVCTFAQAIYDGPGNDFAIFENSFSDDYLEFAFVEVSSDGINFFRFPATCNIQDTLQTGSFGLSDATLVNNLAGKYRGTYGTPFDLNELQGISGLDINSVTHIKIIDVVGSIDPFYATYDKNNHKINDPWSTPFPSSGFDLDAVGVIHQVINSVSDIFVEENISVYPNPCPIGTRLEVRGLTKAGGTRCEVQITNAFGQPTTSSPARGGISSTGESIFFDVSDLQNGIYFLQIKTKDRIINKKIIINE